MAEIEENVELPESGTPGTIDAAWLEERLMGEAYIDNAVLANVAESKSIAYLNKTLSAVLIEFHIDEFDAAVLRMKAPRAVTQLVSRSVFEASTSTGASFAGVSYLSRLGDEIENYALFEGANWTLAHTKISPIDPSDPDLVEVCELFGVTISDSSAA
jgi:hypothetical protein